MVFQNFSVKYITHEERRDVARDLELVSRVSGHVNVLELLGMCEENDATFVALEDDAVPLKQCLLDGRALAHNQSMAERHNSASSIPKETLLAYMHDASAGMEHLASTGVPHGKLCARNVVVVDGRAKIVGFGILDFSRAGQELDHTRWRAREALHAKRIVSEAADVWSFAVMMWEILTLGQSHFKFKLRSHLPNGEINIRRY